MVVRKWQHSIGYDQRRRVRLRVPGKRERQRKAMRDVRGREKEGCACDGGGGTLHAQKQQRNFYLFFLKNLTANGKEINSRVSTSLSKINPI